MSATRVPSADPVDVGLLLEGTYPFVRGGVSSWVHRLLEGLPDTTFSLAFLGGRRADHGPPAYPPLPNVRHFDCQYLFEPPAREEVATRSGHDFADLGRLHHVLSTTARDEPIDAELLQRMARLLGAPGGLTRGDFLRADGVWEHICESHRRECPEGSFTDYFWTLRAMYGSVFGVAELARRLPPARCYHALSTGYAGLLGAILRHRDGRPLVLTEHGIYTKERRIDLASAERVPGDDADRGTPGFGRRLWMRFFHGLGRITYASAHPVVSLYEGSRQRQIQDGAAPDRTRVVPNGVDADRYRSLRSARPAAPPPVLGFVGRVVPVKDVKTFVRAMKAVLARLPEAEGWIVGPTTEDEGYAAECVRLVSTLGLEGRLRFAGFQPAHEILPRLGVLVLTSISEGLPLVVLEAFASGLPVVTTDVGACRELVEGKSLADRELGTAGAVVPMADPEATAGAVLTLLGDPERWRVAQRAAIRRVETHYTERGVFVAYRRIYQEAREWRA